MLAFFLTLLLATSVPSGAGGNQICQDEQQPYGSGLDVLTPAEQARDLNAVTSVAKVLYVPYGASRAATVGYVVRIANGSTYYESRPGTVLTPAQRDAEVKLLVTPGIVPTAGKLTAAERKTARETVDSSRPVYLPISLNEAAFRRNSLRLEHCTPR
jgi:hypothetical protein